MHVLRTNRIKPCRMFEGLRACERVALLLDAHIELSRMAPESKRGSR
jgi:hypothetical protein